VFQRAGRGPLKPNDPLFFSPRGGADGQPHAIRRSMAQKIIKKALSRIASEPQGVSSHSLRKSWGLRLYEASGHDLMIVRDGLGHPLCCRHADLPADERQPDGSVHAANGLDASPPRRRSCRRARGHFGGSESEREGGVIFSKHHYPLSGK
jgi:hypothetical protein